VVHHWYQYNEYVLQDKLAQQVHHTDGTKKINLSKEKNLFSCSRTGPTQFTKTLVRAHISINDCWLVIFATTVSTLELRFSIPIEDVN
jgi:hypothetical protein